MIKIKEFHPILFSTPMVQAIMEDRKTVTRRTKGLERVNQNPDDFEFQSMSFSVAGDELFWFKKEKSAENERALFCLLNNYKRGDVFWVRETFVSYDVIGKKGTEIETEYKADDSPIKFRWKPSIFMPKQACRNFLEITSIEVQRLQDIDQKASLDEGIEIIPLSNIYYKDYLDKKGFFENAIDSFASLWKKINGKESWKANPFVWVYTFKRVERPEGFIV